MKKLLVIFLIFLIFSCEQDETNNEHKEKTYTETDIEQIFGIKLGKKLEEFEENIMLLTHVTLHWLSVYPTEEKFYFHPKPEFKNKHFSQYQFSTSYHFDRVFRIRGFSTCEVDVDCSEIVKRLGLLLMKEYPSLKYMYKDFSRGKIYRDGKSVYTSMFLSDKTSESWEDISIEIMYRRNLWSEIFNVDRDSVINQKGYITFDLMSLKIAHEGQNIFYKDLDEEKIIKWEEEEKRLKKMVDPKGFK